MHISYLTRMKLRRAGIIALTIIALLILIWYCWIIWLERYVVYTREGAVLDFSLGDQSITGEVASAAGSGNTVSIFYNEGSDAIELTKELTKLSGYYIDYDALTKGSLDAFKEDLNKLTAGTAIMIELKGSYGSFYYTSGLTGAVTSASVNTAMVDELITYAHNKGFYLIGKISAFRDYDFGNRNVTSGLYMPSRAGLWMDEGYFWLDPTSANTMSWVTSICQEVKNLGFDEILLDNFRFPTQTDKYIFNGDKTEAITNAAMSVVASVGSDSFVVSFGALSVDFPLPDGRTRLYLSNVDASNVESTAAKTAFENYTARLVFLCSTNDTRYDNYSALRPLSVAEDLEARRTDS